MDPGLVAAAFGHGGEARVRLARLRRSVAVAWCADRDAEARGQAGTSAWEGAQQREGWMALGPRCNGIVGGLDRLQGHAQLGDEGLDQEDMGGDDALSGGQRGSARDGREACLDDVGIAHVVVAAEALQGGALRPLHGLESRPRGEEVAKEGRLLLVNPWQDVRAVVCQGTGEPIREAHVVADEAAALCHAWFEGPYRGALGR